jgi:hypothetical protein
MPPLLPNCPHFLLPLGRSGSVLNSPLNCGKRQAQGVSFAGERRVPGAALPPNLERRPGNPKLPGKSREFVTTGFSAGATMPQPTEPEEARHDGSESVCRNIVST